MSEDKNDAVVNCVEEAITEQQAVGVHNDWKLGKKYKYNPQTVPHLLNAVTAKLDKTGYVFTAPDNFPADCLDMTLADFEDAISDNTVRKP